MTTTAVDPSRADQVALALAEYLAAFHDGFAGYVEPPSAIGRGFDSFIYAFRLGDDGHLGTEWLRRLVRAGSTLTCSTRRKGGLPG